MPLEKRSFMGGMNKDGDVRLIKNPDYIDALNVRAATSVDGTIGSLENIEGNVEVPFEFYSTDPETFFVNDNGLYEEINPGTVFYQKVIRIQGWEQNNQAYNFSLFSVGPNGNVLIGEFNWNGNTGHTFTSFYLNSQFSSVGPFNSGINVYEVNTGNQFTASVKLLSFGQNSMLHGGYFDIVIECDTPGVNFNLSVSSNVDSDSLIYTYDEEQTGIPISVSENLSVFLLPGFESGGVFNTDTNDDGVVVSPDGTLYEVGNRTVWRISFIAGEEPTSPTSFDEVTIYSYRDNLNPADETFEFEFEPFLTINQGTFSSGGEFDGEFEFDSNQNKLSAFLHRQFSESKSVLCDGLPLNFNIDPEKFFLTFSENATFDGTNDFSIVVVGPVGVRFKLAMLDSSENLMVALQPGNEISDGEVDFATIFGNGTVMLLQNYQIVQNSIEITNSIVNSFTVLQEELENAIQNFYELELISIEQTINNNILEADLQAQIALTNQAIANLDQATIDLEDATQIISDLEGEIINFQQTNDILADQNLELLEDVQNFNTGLGQLSNAILNLSTDIVPSIPGPDVATLPFNTLAADVILLISQLNQFQTSQSSFIDNFNETFEDHLEAAGLPLVTDFINIITSVEDIISNVIDTLNENNAEAIQGYIDEIANINSAHALTVSNLENASAQDLEDAQNLHILNINNLENYYLNIIGSAETGEGLQGDIASLESENAVFGNEIDSLLEELDNAENVITSLQEQLNEQRISDAIIVATLSQYNDTYTSLSNFYSQTLTIYNALSLENQVIYQPGMNNVSEFQGDFILYEGLFSDANDLNVLSSFGASGNIINPSGSEIQGGLILPLSSSFYTAVRLPYSSFTNQGAWQNGNEISITMMFNSSDVGTAIGSSSIPSNFSVSVTNMWDDSNQWVNSGDYGFEIFQPVTNGSSTGINFFEHTFTVVNTNESNFLSKWANITIIIPPVSSQQVNDFQIMLTQIRLSNDAQEAIDFNLNNLVPTRRDLYLESYNEANDTILNWQSSGLETLSEFIPEENVYNYFLGKVIPGFLDDPNFVQYLPYYTIGGRLQRYADAVINFSNAVQNQVYNSYVNYFQASQANPEDLLSLQQQHAEEISIIQDELDAAEANVINLQNEIIYLSDNSGAFLTGPNVGATLVTFVGTDTSGISSSPISFSPYGNQDYRLSIQYMIDGSRSEVATLLLLTSSECQALANQPHSETNNIVYYLTNRFQNGQTIDFIPSGLGYPTQKLVCLFVNFNEGTSTIGDGVPFLGAVSGIDISESPWNSFITNPDDLFQHRDIQMIFYFDQLQYDNVPATEDIQFIGLYGASLGDTIASNFDDHVLYGNTARYTTITAF